MNGYCGRTPLVIALCLALFSLIACSDSGETVPAPPAGPAVESTPQSRPVPAVVGMTSNSQPVTADKRLTPEQQIAHARADLAERLGLDPAEISVARSGPVTWRSGALGCPKPDMNYTMALVPGFQVVLQAGEATYHYHAASGLPPFYCPQSLVESPSPSGPAYE